MNGNTALDLVMARLVRSSDTSLRATARAEMNNLMHTALEMGPMPMWFLLDQDTSVSTAVGTETVAMPAGFLRFDDNLEVGGVFLYDTDITGPDKWVRLDRSGFNKMQDFYGDEDATGVPGVYDIVVDTAYLRPIPDGVYQLNVWGYFADSDVADAATTNLWLTHAADLLIATTAELLARVYLRNAELAVAMQEDIKRATIRLATANTAFMESMKMRAMGDD